LPHPLRSIASIICLFSGRKTAAAHRKNKADFLVKFCAPPARGARTAFAARGFQFGKFFSEPAVFKNTQKSS